MGPFLPPFAALAGLSVFAAFEARVEGPLSSAVLFLPIAVKIYENARGVLGESNILAMMMRV